MLSAWPLDRVQNEVSLLIQYYENRSDVFRNAES